MAQKMNMLLAKAGLMRDGGKASMVSDLRRNQNKGSGAVLIPAREEDEVRTCEGNKMTTPRLVKKKGQEMLQAPELRFLCRPWCRAW